VYAKMKNRKVGEETGIFILTRKQTFIEAVGNLTHHCPLPYLVTA
jgi:hypothetical protein